jgi:dynactin complex subunit
MSEEDRSINEIADLSSDEEKVAPTDKPEVASEPELESEEEIMSPITKEAGVDEASTEEAIREQGEQVRTPTAVEQPQLRPQTKPKKQTKSMSTMKNQRFLVDASKQIEKQTAQINKINQNLQSLQKQMRSDERQSEVVNQIRSQVNRIQKQISQIQKTIQKGSSRIVQSGKREAINKKKNKK